MKNNKGEGRGGFLPLKRGGGGGFLEGGGGFLGGGGLLERRGGLFEREGFIEDLW